MKTVAIPNKNKLPMLEPHKVAWIFDAAREHFGRKIDDFESEIARHNNSVVALLPFTTWEPHAKSRQERIEQCRKWIATYHEIVVFCTICHEAAMHQSTERFAQAFKEMMASRKEPTP